MEETVKISLTRTDCFALAVTEAVIAKHLGLREGVHFADSIDITPRHGCDRVVEIRTPKFHESPSQKFVVVVGNCPDEDYEYDAELYEDDVLLKKFKWDFCGSRIDGLLDITE